MITIMPADKAELQALRAPAGVDALILRGSDGQVEGHALFHLEGDTVEILSVTCDEPIMVSGMLRSVLNAGDHRGADFGFCRVEALADELRRLEFQQADNGWRISIAEFFRGKCTGE